MFEIKKLYVAPAGSGLKDWEVSIQVSGLGSRHGIDRVIGASCRSQSDLDEVVSDMIRELKKLKFPKT